MVEEGLVHSDGHWLNIVLGRCGHLSLCLHDIEWRLRVNLWLGTSLDFRLRKGRPDCWHSYNFLGEVLMPDFPSVRAIVSGPFLVRRIQSQTIGRL